MHKLALLQVQNLSEGLRAAPSPPSFLLLFTGATTVSRAPTTAHLALAREHRQLHNSIAPAQHRSFTASTSATTQLASSASAAHCVSTLIPRAGPSSCCISLGAQIRCTAQHPQCAFQQHCGRLSAIARSSARARSTLALAFACTARARWHPRAQCARSSGTDSPRRYSEHQPYLT
jgi:hypothetical protein